jgi:hypothetical protein
VIDWATRKLDAASQCLCQSLSDLADAIFTPLVEAADPNPVTLSPEERERIAQSLWSLRRDLEDLASPGFIEDFHNLLDQAFGSPEAFVEAVKSWADLVDTLVWAAERDYGSEAGRGWYKRRNVKGGLLYLVHKGGIGIPDVPSFLMPVVWNVVLDPAVDIVVQISNRHSLWRGLPEKPSPRARVRIGAQRLGSWFDTLALWLAGIEWRLILLFSPASPSLRAAVDEFLKVNPDPVRTVMLCSAWAVRNSGNLVAAADLVSVAVREADFVLHQDAARRKAYAREFLLAFLDQEFGLPQPDSLAYHLIQTAIDLGIEVVITVFEKHPPASSDRPVAKPVAAAHP